MDKLKRIFSLSMTIIMLFSMIAPNVSFAETLPNNLPGLIPLVEILVDEGEIKTITPDEIISDIDNDPLTFTNVSSVNSSVVEASLNLGGNIEVAGITSGNTDIEISVTDGTDTVTLFVPITVNEVIINNPPSLIPSLEILVDEGNSYVLTASEIAVDVDNDLLNFTTDSLVSQDPTVATVTLKTDGTVEVTGLVPGSTILEISVFDGTNTVTLFAPIIVNEVAVDNTVSLNISIENVPTNSISYDVFYYDPVTEFVEELNYGEPLREGEAYLIISANDGSNSYLLGKEVILQAGVNNINISQNEISTITLNFEISNHPNASIYMLSITPFDGFGYGTTIDSNTVKVLKGEYYGNSVSVKEENLVYEIELSDYNNISSDIAYNFDINFTANIFADYINTANSTSPYELFSVEDSNNNQLMSVFDISTPMWADLPANIRVYEDTTEAFDSTTEVYIGSFSSISWDSINFGDLNGSYDIQIEIPTTTPIIVEKSAVQFENSGTSVPINTFLPNLNIDLTNDPVIDFTTSSNIDYSTADKLFISISGNLPEGMILGNNSGYINDVFKNYNLKLTNLDNQIEVTLTNAYGQFRDRNSVRVTDGDVNSDPNAIFIYLDLGTGLEPFTNYRISFESKATNLLTKFIASSIYTDSPEDMNLILHISDSKGTEDWQDDEELGFAFKNFDNGYNTASIKEFNSSDSIVFSGPEVEFKLGNTAMYSDVSEVVILIEGNDTLTFPNVSASINNNDISTTFTSDFSNGINEYSFTLPVNEVVFNNVDTSLILASDDMQALKDSISNYIYGSRDNGNVYLLAYNSVGALIGYKKYNEIEEAVYVNLGMRMDQPSPIIGRIIGEGEGYRHLNYGVYLEYTGIMNANRVVIDGITTPENGEPIPFILTAGQEGEGNYRSDFNLEGYKSSNLREIPIWFDRITYRNDNSTDLEWFNQIPVNTGVKNTIQLSFTNDLEDTVPYSFDWYPTHKYDIFDHAEVKEHNISPYINEFDVELIEFYGNKDKIKLQLYTIDPITFTETPVAEFNSVISQEDYVYQDVDPEGNLHQQNRSTLSFLVGQDGFNNLDTL